MVSMTISSGPGSGVLLPAICIRIRGHALHVVLRPQIVRAVFRDVGEHIAVLPFSGAVRRARHRILPKAGFRIMGFYRDGLFLAPALVPLHRINDRRVLVDVVDDERIRLRHIACQVARIGVVTAVLSENEGRFRRGIHPGDRVRGMTAPHIFFRPVPSRWPQRRCYRPAPLPFAQFSVASQVRCVSTFTTTGGTISSAVTFTFAAAEIFPALSAAQM